MKNKQNVRYVKELPAESTRYGMITVGRVNSTGTHLVGSELDHQQFISLKIAKASYERTLKKDWFFDRENLIEISMTLSQWAEFISTPNTAGVVCTIDRFNGEKLYEKELVPVVNSIELHQEEYQTHWKNSIAEMKEIMQQVQQGFEEKLIGRKELRSLLHALEVKINSFIPNERFALDQFNKHIEDRVNQAKTEINSYLMRYGITQEEQLKLPNMDLSNTMSIESKGTTE